MENMTFKLQVFLGFVRTLDISWYRVQRRQMQETLTNCHRLASPRVDI